METEATSSQTTPRAIRKSTVIKTPSSLHDVIVDYLITHAYLDTAQSLVDTDTNTRSKPEDGDGDGDGDGDEDVDMETAEASNSTNIRLDQETVNGIERRRSIINHILNGAIQKAIDEIEEYYPAVLLPTPGDGTDKNGSINGQGTSNSGSNGAHPPVNTNGNGNSNSNGIGSGSGNGNGTSPSQGTSTRPAHAVYGIDARGVMSYSNRQILENNTNNNKAPTPTVKPPPRNLEQSTNTDQLPNSIPTFPNSTHPSHILLNLHIQQFIESFRSLPQTMSPGSSTSSLTSNQNNNLMSMSMSMSMSIPNATTTTNGNGVGGLQQALTAASGLHAEAALLDPSARAVYVREITDAGALFAYTDPEDSPVSGFLRQERRIILAEQVNRAILQSEGQPTQSLLERFSRRTSATYSLLKDAGVDPRSHWYGGDDKGREQIGKWWKTQNTTFNLSDFVQQGYI